MFTKENVISAKFINEEHTTIEVVHTIEGDDKAHSYILEYDKDSQDFQALEKAGWDLERITEETMGYKKESSRIYDESIQAAADEILKEDRKAIKEEWESLKEQWTKSDLSWKEANEALEKAKKVEVIIDRKGIESFLDTIIHNNEDEDTIFKTKLAVFELDTVKKSTNKNAKKELRKAKTLIQVYAALNLFME
jgi:hypothetical protein